MSALPDEAKTFIVQQLACFDTPSEVARQVKDTFEIEVSRQAVEAYDPNKVQGRGLSEAYREIFAATRKAFLEDTAEIAISHRSVRMREIQKLVERAKGQGNLVLVASLLEQAAKEAGNAFTNKREVGGLGGGAIQADVAVRPDMSALNQAGRDALRTILEQVAVQPGSDAPGA